MGIGGLGGGDDLVLAGARLTECDVFADRAAEQEGVLPDIGNMLAQRGRDTWAMSCSSMTILPRSAS
jgi:hypothetical protein